MNNDKLYYCYCKQTWIENGRILGCGHPASLPKGHCYACDHAGEDHDCTFCGGDHE